MKQPLLVGVRHDVNDDDRLLDRKCRERFTQEVFPLIDQNTLLLLEGKYRESYVNTRPFFSFLERWKVTSYVGAPIGRPTIGWRDGRYLTKPALQFGEEIVGFALFMRKNIRGRALSYPTTRRQPLLNSLTHSYMTG